MQKFLPALKVILVVSIVVLAAATVLGLVVGAEKPFALVLPMLMGLVSLGLLPAAKLSTPKCPSCGTLQPAIRKPTSLRQWVWGGWTCAACGTEIDRHGRAIDKTASR